MKTKTAFITGGAGFIGTILKPQLIDKNYRVISIDLEKDSYKHKNFTAFQGDIRSKKTLDNLVKKYKPSVIFHLAAQMPHAVKNKQDFWRTNVDGTRNVAEVAKKHNVKHVIFTSSNCLWCKDLGRPVLENDQPCPREIYGRSKMEGENILHEYEKFFNVVIFRCPPVIDIGRAGNIAIMFEFISENRKLWMVGKGNNRYQMISAHDLINAMILALSYKKSNTFGIGSDNVPTFRETYEYVIKNAHSKSRPASFPPFIIRPIMRITNLVGLQPLGVYFQEMIDKDFSFDTTLIKNELGWKPTMNNCEMLYESYKYYIENRSSVKSGYTNKDAAKMGIIRILKWLS